MVNGIVPISARESIFKLASICTKFDNNDIGVITMSMLYTDGEVQKREDCFNNGDGARNRFYF